MRNINNFLDHYCENPLFDLAMTGIFALTVFPIVILIMAYEFIAKREA